ncbi:MAG: ABC transporter permease [Acidimicrobiales bacterium]
MGQQAGRSSGGPIEAGGGVPLGTGSSAAAVLSRAEMPQRVVAAKVDTVTRLREIWAARELLVFLVRKELKVRYKNSVLGFLWSFLNPAMILLIYYVVFQYIVPNHVPDFAIFLFCGLLPWNLFNTSLLSAAGTLVAHAGIVKKVAFPREVLALAQVGTAVCYFFFQTCIMVVFLAAFHVLPDWKYLPILFFALVCDVIFSAAIALLLSALNVYMRDIEHLIQVVLVALFFAEPIVYTFAGVGAKLAKHHLTWLYLLNPLTPMVLAFQKCIYGEVQARPGAPLVLALYGHNFFLELLGACLAASVVLFYVAMRVFRRVEGNFAEEL